MYSFNETIAAIATPPGEGAIGIIRLSGKDAISIADKIFSGKKLSEQKSHTIHFGKITDGKDVIDEVVVSLYKGPKSYTGEDVIEISCHGSQYVLEKVLALCLQNGANVAKAGEFTQRAFLNNKMDLTQAEAVADLIASQSSSAHNAAIHNLRGGFSDELKDLREQLIQFSALLELELDFSEEDVEFADRTRFYELIAVLTDTTQRLIDSFSLGNVIKKGVSVAIVGKPNAGKSTLLNALLNEDRAIVSDIAGTTRDSIEEVLNINGILFRLIDTAGIREHTSDIVETMGVQRSRDIMKRADIIVYLFDVNEESANDLQKQKDVFEQEGAKYLLVGNKTDITNSRFGDDVLYISAKSKENIQDLKQALYDNVIEGKISTEGTIVTNARHHASLQEVNKSLKDIKTGMDNNISGDLIALDLRRCLHYLGEITGQVTTEDKLDYIFSKFCIGK
ncbi:MAG: tRNA uridine-5-carboxymethylaminomethyl(34) synthesis GTPase MnmE [Chitinophagales bacterium]|nr:tRNA uridine-5-carboxymethylaminomethyl(34) synthesis GTPase MnmE [Chitinophagaceae bacterium]MCB9065432.1 tRNA uridine-5-carboxymethylaminomethyl(34) synthesis GTPase MnmE [Chitinophagales bacterium]